MRYRIGLDSKEFYPFDYPKLNRTRAIYYFSKYSKNEAPIIIKINDQKIIVNKGEYFEDILPIRKEYEKVIECINDSIKIGVNIQKTKDGVILFKRKKDGTLTYDQLNENMVPDFLKRKEKLKKISP